MSLCVKWSFMGRRFRPLAVAIAVFSFVFTILAYACPERAMTWGTALRLAPHSEMKGMEPCANDKTDTCQLVRDRMLSAGISTSPATISHHVLTSAPHAIAMESAVGLNMLHDRGPPSVEYAFHSVFKLQLPLSYLVLRL